MVEKRTYFQDIFINELACKIHLQYGKRLHVFVTSRKSFKFYNGLLNRALDSIVVKE